MEQIGLFYGSSTGNTEEAAQKIASEFGNDKITVMNVSDASADDVNKFSNVIFGASTWGIGDMQDDFESFLDLFDSIDFNNKKVAIYGLGDQDGYPDSFVDAIGEIYEKLNGKGCQLVGKTEKDEYTYDESRAEADGKLLGLALDEDNQSNLSDDRISDWVTQLKKEFI